MTELGKMGRPAISVVIRCYNEEKHIGKLLVGVLHQTVSPVEVIVVDSGSTDGTREIAQSFPVRLLHIRPEDFSFGRALNLGCAAATAPVVAFASAHVYPRYHDWLEHLLRPFEDPKVALAYGKQRGDEVTRFSEHQIFATWFGDEPQPHQSSPFCNNANAAIRRELWEKLPYDEDLTGLEDLHWAKRAQELGFGVSYVPEAEVVHVHEESPARIYNRYRREAIALRQIFPEQRFGIRDLFGLAFSNIAADYWHAGRDGKLLRHLVDIPVFRLMQFWGTYRGFSRVDPVTSSLRRTFYYPRAIRSAASPSSRQAGGGREMIDYEPGPRDYPVPAKSGSGS